VCFFKSPAVIIMHAQTRLLIVSVIVKGVVIRPSWVWRLLFASCHDEVTQMERVMFFIIDLYPGFSSMGVL